MADYRLIVTPPARGAWNMAVDQSILEHIHRGEARPTLRLYAWNPPCLSLGRAADWDSAAQAFVHAFEAQLGLNLVQDELSKHEIARAEELIREKYDHPSWTERA